jgi:hypothetical protein
LQIIELVSRYFSNLLYKIFEKIFPIQLDKAIPL